MKKIYVLGMILLVVSTLAASISLDYASSDLIKLNCSIDQYDLIDIKPQGKNFTKIISAGGESLKPGAPDLPTQAVWIAIPPGTNPQISISSSSQSKMKLNNLISPVPQPAAETKDTSAPGFVLDKQIYNSGGIFPAQLAALEKESLYRSLPCAVIRFYPFQYDFTQNELIIHHDISVSISFTGSSEPLEPAFYNPQMAEFISANMINGRQIIQELEFSESARNREEGAELLIICPEEFIESAHDLADWKTKRGISTQIVSTLQTGSTAFTIKEWIVEYCNSHDPIPASLLLFGDAEFIPPWYVHEFPGEGLLGSDVYYADLEIEFDFVLDFSFGRIPVDTVEDAQRIVENIINYESNPPEEAGFYQNATIAGAFQDGENEPPDTYANRRFAKTSEDIRNFLELQSYNTQRIYTEYNGYNNQVIYPTYWNPNSYIFENDIPGGELDLELQKPQFPWNGSQQDVSNALNQGSFLLTHRDHGGRSGWGEPDFGSSDVLNLQNNDLLPVVWSINCLTGYFDNETDDSSSTGWNDECFAERWFRNSSGGAIGVIASTRVSFSGNNDRFVWGLMDAIWPSFLQWCGADYPTNNPVYRMGDVVNYAKTYLATNYSLEDYLIISLEEFEWFGDPTLEIRIQEPEQLNVSHPAEIEFGQENFLIDTGIPGAVCTLTSNGALIAEAVSGFNNTAVFELPEMEYIPYLELTVWYTQSVPYSAIIPLSIPEQGFLQIDDLQINDSLANNNGQADFNELIALDIEFTNIGSESLALDQITLSSDDEYINITGSTFDYNDAVLPEQTFSLSGAFEIEIADDCPDMHQVQISINTANQSITRVIILHAPVLEVGYYIIDDTQANGNHAADPGEDFIIELNVYNNGSAIAQDISMMLLSYDTSLTITPDQVLLDSLLGQTLLQFNASALSEAVVGEPYYLQAFVNSGPYSADLAMSGIYGVAVEDFESGDFSLYNWQMSGSYNWIIDTEAASGNYSARSDYMSSNSSARLEISGFLAEEATISFYRKLFADTSLPGNDGGVLYFLIDDEEIDSWGGNSNWMPQAYTVPAGPHVFAWLFEKDNDPTTGQDGAWIDAINFPSMSEPPPPQMEVDTQQISVQLATGSASQESFSIANSGAGTLEYYVFFMDSGSRTLEGSYLTLSSYSYSPGETLGWMIELFNNSTDGEAITDLEIAFPDEISVNVSTPINGGSGGSMTTNGATGSGATVIWHGETAQGNGVLLPGESALGAVNITIDSVSPLAFNLTPQISGDNGSIISQNITVGSLDCGYISLNHNHGQLTYGQTREVVLDFDAQDLLPGEYYEELHILDQMGSQVILPLQLSVTSTDENQEEIPLITKLQSIHPNPFNPETAISFSLAADQQVKVDIYNIKGQKVDELANTEMSAGAHRLIWQADTFPSGVYFLRFITRDYTKSSKLLLLK